MCSGNLWKPLRLPVLVDGDANRAFHSGPGGPDACAKDQESRPAPATSTRQATRPASPPTAPPARSSPLTKGRSTPSYGQIIQIAPLSAGAGGVADAAAQDKFCAGTTCLIHKIFDQTGNGNHLKKGPPGTGGRGTDPGDFDIWRLRTGRRRRWTGRSLGKIGAGRGPWVGGDLENGIFGSDTRQSQNPNNPSVTSRFVTAILKGKAGNHWALRGGNAASGALHAIYSGKRPSGGYNPMKKEGAITLGVGGDNSNRAQGTFYEGAITVAGSFPSDATENAVQADIVAAKYAATNLTTGPAVTVGSAVSFRATTDCCKNSYVSHQGLNVTIRSVDTSSSTAAKRAASWNVVAGLVKAAANQGCVSFEARDKPGHYLRHLDAGAFAMRAGIPPDSSSPKDLKLFNEDATWCPQSSLNAAGTNAVRSWNSPIRYMRHFKGEVFAARREGREAADTAKKFFDDVSWVVEAAVA
ncbi:Alpha-L-arabinofuranosidase B domain protein [Mycena kentingensis (nom. inval.)]|nr:Alpha-L-arabinofuranosidase B domain protein [Mycena kentingensis (nom. inval.)]